MNHPKPFLHVTIDAVDLVLHDPEGRRDDGRSDRYATFDEARDAALSCVEILLDEGDYDDQRHREELELALRLLEGAGCYADLERSREYRGLLRRLSKAAGPAAA